MAKRISDKTKQSRKMGTGHGANYIPYLTTSEFNSQGTTSVVEDWKTGKYIDDRLTLPMPKGRGFLLPATT